jgi:hypothetical protein
MFHPLRPVRPSPDFAMSEANMVSKVAPFDPSGSAMSTVAGKTVISAGPARKSESFEDTSSLSQSVVVSFRIEWRIGLWCHSPI